MEIDGVWKVVRVALIPEMPVDLLIGVNDLALASSGEMLSDDHNLMVMTRQQKRQQMIARQENQTTAVTASPAPLTTVGDQSNNGNAEIKDLLSDEDQAGEQITDDTHNGIQADKLYFIASNS